MVLAMRHLYKEAAMARETKQVELPGTGPAIPSSITQTDSEVPTADDACASRAPQGRTGRPVVAPRPSRSCWAGPDPARNREARLYCVKPERPFWTVAWRAPRRDRASALSWADLKVGAYEARKRVYTV